MVLTTMSWIYLALFLGVTAVHLYASYQRDQYLRGITKGLILMSILGFYLETSTELVWFLVFALLFSWLGDLFLLGKGVKWFVVGGFSFFTSHVLFVLAYNREIAWSRVPVLLASLLFVFFLGSSVATFLKLKVHLRKALIPPMFVYLVVNGIMNCFAWFRLISLPTVSTAITAFGALLFFISDVILFFVRFNKSSYFHSHFLPMLAYCLAEFLIVFGMCS